MAKYKVSEVMVSINNGSTYVGAVHLARTPGGNWVPSIWRDNHDRDIIDSRRRRKMEDVAMEVLTGELEED